MPSNMKRDFHRAAFNALNVFIKFFDAMSKHPDMVRSYNALPDAVRDGRTMTQMALDDLLDAYAYVMRRVEEENIPLSFFKQIMQYREDRAIADEEARAALGQRLAAARLIKEDDLNPPEFLRALGHTAPEEHRDLMIKNFRIVIGLMPGMTMEDKNFSSQTDGSDYMDSFNKSSATLMSILKTQQDRFQEVSKPSEPNPAPDNDTGSTEEEDDIGEDSFEDLAERVRTSGMPDEIMKVAKKKLRRLQMIDPSGSEYIVAFTHLDWLASLPWKEPITKKVDIAKARRILDTDHFGMFGVKERILEFLAVQNQTGKTGATVLCIDGPPGTGKTSIVKSIAKATGRKFIRMALGSVNDKADIRGHRSTYIGALPGRFISAMKDAGVKNPLINLDEIDKLSQSYTGGDPAAALLDILDPEQNHAFHDHYLGVDYDLSNVMFVCTSNYLDRIPPALLDRMDVIRVGSYTREEKFEIARRHLIPKQIKRNGLNEGQLSIDDQALRTIITSYTAESGVRELERMIGKICRKAVLAIQENKKSGLKITPDTLGKVLGGARYSHENIPDEDVVGQVNGLAYTSVGGCILQIQATMRDAPALDVRGTGLLGQTMQESLKYVAEALHTMAPQLGLDRKKIEKSLFHVHVPAAAIPKDGPSAGMAIATAMISAATNIKVRRDVAMTGEMDKFGNILPIGGLKEKIEGAADAGATTVLIPHGNLKDLAAVPEAVRSRVHVIPVKRIEETLKLALTGEIQPVTSDNVVDFTKACRNECPCQNGPDQKKTGTGGPGGPAPA